MSYSIGQIIFVLSNKTQKVLPGIIREDIYYRSVDGEKVSYKISIGSPAKQRIVDLSSVDGEVYGSIEEVRSVLINKLTTFVDELTEETNQRVIEWYGGASSQVQHSDSGGRLDPSDLLNEVQTHHQNTNTPRNNLRSAMSDPDLNSREVIMDDGSIRKVSINIAQS